MSTVPAVRNITSVFANPAVGLGETQKLKLEANRAKRENHLAQNRNQHITQTLANTRRSLHLTNQKLKATQRELTLARKIIDNTCHECRARQNMEKKPAHFNKSDSNRTAASYASQVEAENAAQQVSHLNSQLKAEREISGAQKKVIARLESELCELRASVKGGGNTAVLQIQLGQARAERTELALALAEASAAEERAELNLKSAAKNAEKKEDALRRENSSLIHSGEKLTSELAETRKQLREMAEARLRATELLNASENKCASAALEVQDQKNQFDAELKSVADSLNRTREKITRLTNEIRQANERTDAAVAKGTALEMELAQAKEELKRETQRAANLKEHSSRLKQDIAVLTAKSSSEEGRAERDSASREILVRRLQTSEVELRRACRERDRLSSRLGAALSELSHSVTSLRLSEECQRRLENEISILKQRGK